MSQDYENRIFNEDCLTGMARLPDGCVDMILCDLPYGTTQNKWDAVISFELLWEQYRRVVKKDGAIVLFAGQPFTSQLICSNRAMYRYNWVWRKTTATGFLNAKKQPLRNHEDICVFYRQQPAYNPQKTTGHARKVSTAAHKRNCAMTGNYREHNLTSYDSTERYPKTVLEFKTDKQHAALHPTQKPVALCEYLVRTYTSEGDLVLDSCMGSGTTAVACIRTGRQFVGFEKDKQYYDIAASRIAKAISGNPAPTCPS